jgi:hypothetical protein
MIRSLGVELEGPTLILGDNMSVVLIHQFFQAS